MEIKSRALIFAELHFAQTNLLLTFHKTSHFTLSETEIYDALFVLSFTNKLNEMQIDIDELMLITYECPRTTHWDEIARIPCKHCISDLTFIFDLLYDSSFVPLE